MKTLAEKVKRNLSKQPRNYFSGSGEAYPFIPQNIIVLPRGHEMPPSRRDSVHHRYLLAINLEGQGELVVDSIRFVFSPGSCCLIFPYQYHHFNYGSDHIWIFITFELPEDQSPEQLRGRIISPLGSFYKYLEDMVDGSINRQANTDENPENLTLLLALLLNILLVHSPSRQCLAADSDSGVIKNELIDRVNRYIMTNLGKVLLPDDLAAEFGYSTSHFRALYRKKMGISLMSYIRQQRLNLAMGLLRNSDMSVGDVARRVGYDSSYAFSHAFRNFFGKSPSCFKNIV